MLPLLSGFPNSLTEIEQAITAQKGETMAGFFP